MMQQQQQQQQEQTTRFTIIERTDNSIFQELEEFVQQQQWVNNKVLTCVETLERLVRDCRRPIFLRDSQRQQQEQQLLTTTWATLLRLPREFLSAERQLSFDLVKRDELQAGRLFVKVIAKHLLDAQQPILSVVLRVPTYMQPRENFRHMLLHLANIRITREGLLLLKVPMRQEQSIINDIDVQKKLDYFFNDNNTKTGVTIIERQLVQQTECTVFQELQQWIRQEELEQEQELEKMMITSPVRGDFEAVERMLRRRENLLVIKDQQTQQPCFEWATVVPMHQYAPQEVTFKVVLNAGVRDVAAHVKITAQKLGKSLQSIVVRVPTHFANVERVLRRLRVVFTRDGVAVIRMPLTLEDITNTGVINTTGTPFFTGEFKQEQQRFFHKIQRERLFVQRVERAGLFQELFQDVVLPKMMIQQQQQFQFTDIDMLQRQLNQQNNLLQLQSTGDFQWATVLPLKTCDYEYIKPEDITYKVERDVRGQPLLKIYQQRQQATIIVGDVNDEAQKIIKEIRFVLRLPRVCDQRELRQLRVQFIRDAPECAALLIRLPLSRRAAAWQQEQQQIYNNIYDITTVTKKDNIVRCECTVPRTEGTIFHELIDVLCHNDDEEKEQCFDKELLALERELLMRCYQLVEKKLTTVMTMPMMEKDEEKVALMSLLERVMLRRNNVFPRHWATFVRVQKHLNERDLITYKVEQDAARECTFVKIFVKKQLKQLEKMEMLEDAMLVEKRMFQVRVPQHLVSQLRHLRVMLTREGFVVLRMPIITRFSPQNSFLELKELKEEQQQMLNDVRNKCPIVYESLKQRLECEPAQRSLFQELQRMYYDIMRTTDFEVTGSLQQLQRFLRQRANFMKNTLTQSNEWTTVVRVPMIGREEETPYYTYQQEQQQQQQILFKVQQDSRGKTWLQIYKINNSNKKSINTMMTLVKDEPDMVLTSIRLPTGLFNEAELRNIRLQHFTREGALLIRVPIFFNTNNKRFNIIEEQQEEDTMFAQLPRTRQQHQQVFPLSHDLTQELQRIILKNNNYNIINKMNDFIVNEEEQQQLQAQMCYWTLEQWERELSRRNNVIKRGEVTHVVRMQQRPIINVNELTFTLQRDSVTGCLLVHIFYAGVERVHTVRIPDVERRFWWNTLAAKKSFDKLIGEREIVLRLLECQQRGVRVFITRDGHLLVRVPTVLFANNFFFDNIINNKDVEENTFFNSTIVKELDECRIAKVWQRVPELCQARRVIFEDVLPRLRSSTFVEARPTFAERQLLLDLVLPLNIRALEVRDVRVRTEDQLVSLTLRTLNNNVNGEEGDIIVKKFWLPRELSVRDMRVVLLKEERRVLRFVIPLRRDIIFLQQEQQQKMINNTLDNTRFDNKTYFDNIKLIDMANPIKDEECFINTHFIIPSTSGRYVEQEIKVIREDKF